MSLSINSFCCLSSHKKGVMLFCTQIIWNRTAKNGSDVNLKLPIK